jgi:hypothetical protein
MKTNKEKNSSISSWIGGIFLLIVAFCLGFVESGNLLGGAIALLIAFFADLSALLGLIPFGGPLLHALLVYPWISSVITAFQPGIQIPITLLVIFIVSTMLSIIFCIATSLVIVALVAS